MKKYILPVAIATTAVMVSLTAAFYSITGLSKLFAGAAVPVMVMASVLEFSKLVTATLLHNYWGELKTILKTYLSVAVIVLVLITSLGIYGFLTAAYQQTASASTVVENEIKLLNTNRDFIDTQLQDLLVERTQLAKGISDLRSALGDNKIQYTDAKGNLITTTSSANRVALEKQLEQSIKRQSNLNTQVDSINIILLNLNMEIVKVENSVEVASELGPLKYVASLTGLEVDRVVNYLVLVIIFVFDPLAISLVLAANFAFARLENREQAISFDKPLDPEFQETLNTMLHEKIDNEPTITRFETITNPQPDEPVVEEKMKQEKYISRNAGGDVSKQNRKIIRKDSPEKRVY